MSWTVAGAAKNSSTEPMPMTLTARVRTVWANGAASPGASRRSVVNTGTNGAVSPAATRTSSSSSGSTNAALYASSSGPAPYVRAKMRSRTSPAR